MRRQEIIPLGLLLLGYLLLGTLFAVRTPDWQAPDEPAHYNYVRQLIEGELPVIETGDWDQAYLGEIVGAEFDPIYSTGELTYEDWQPPLYYLLQAPIYGATNGSLTAMRLMSVAMGAVVVILAYIVGRRVFEGRVPRALAVAAFVAFLPQHLAILGSVNNDSLAELIIAAVLAMMVAPWPDRPSTGRLLALGLLLGAGFLTKGTVYLMAPVTAIFLLVRYWPRPDRSEIRGQQLQSRLPRRLFRLELFRTLVIVFVPAAIFGLLLWGRNMVVYGGLDVLARTAHDKVVVGQPRTAEWIAQYGLGDTIARFLRTTFNSFWGQFGWMAAPLPGWMVTTLAILTMVATVGLSLAIVDRRRPTAGSPKRLHFLVLGLTFALTVALHVGYNLTFVQHQGRYLFPALIPIAVGFAVGLGYWLRPLERRWPWVAYLLPLGIAVCFSGIALFSLVRIVPGLAPG